MSDKSFGDCPSRNIVKNPLLSTAVTGLSIEDLTHNAVLVPVAATQGLITRSEPHIGTNIQTLAHSEHEFTNFPSGDSNTNVFSPQTTTSAYPPSLDHPQNIHHDKKPEISTSTVSKAPAKSEDDFDVNEYFARLQGTRYVSAPINSNPDQNANLEATEDNLEEINLNDDKNVEVQQSLTADIAQNFSQLPTVLPHVASAVFSSFSNMLNYKSREQTPDERQSNQNVPFQNPVPPGPMYPGQNFAVDTPLMAEDVVKEVAPPPKEPPVSGSTNFRITTKKKYAQIPGLSSGHNFETAQQIELNPLTKNSKGYFIPNINNDNIDAVPKETIAHENNTTVINPPNEHETYNIFNPIDTVIRASDFQPITSGIPQENEPKPFEDRLPPPPSYASLYGENTASYPANPIAPPPMFSSQRRDIQTGKAVLPPSVARRIGSNHPVIKPQVMQSINTDNIFVPTFDPIIVPSEAQPIGSSFSDVHSQSLLVTQQPISKVLSREPASLPPSNISSIPPPAQFISQPPPGFGAPPDFEPPPLAPHTSVIAPPSKAPPRIPPQKLASPPTNTAANIIAPPMFPPTLPSNAPTMFVPFVDTKSNTGAESLPPLSNIFSPAPPVATQSIFSPGQSQPAAIGSLPNVGLPSFFTPQPTTTNVVPTFYNPEKASEHPKPGQPLVSESPKPLMEPPKSTGAVNFRMNKKKPQYYSGPIEGVGSISNSIKPVMPTIDSGTFQGALFTPEQLKVEQNVQSTVPFDINKQVETTPLIPQYNVANPPVNIPPPTALDIGQPAATYHHFDISQPVQNNHSQFNTAFDLSRPTTESYEPQEEPKESKGFGIIGSLKSKLSNIDINKIQHSVTTFFDPAYKDAQNQESSETAQQNVPYSSVPYQTQATETNLEIFVPNAQQNTAYNYDYQQHQHAIYLNDQYYKFPNFQNQGQPAAGHCSDHHHYPHSKGYTDESQSYSETGTNAPSPGDGTERITNDPPKPKDDTPSVDNSQKTSAERNLDENVARLEPDVAQKIQDVTSIEQKSAISFFDMAASNMQDPLEVPKANLTITRPVVPPLAYERTFISDSFKQIEDKPKVPKPDPISFFETKTVDLFPDMTIFKEANEETKTNLFANTSFDERKKQNISNYGAQNVELFANIGPSNEKAESKENIPKIKDDIKTHTIYPRTMFDSKEIIIPKDSLLDSLSKDDVPILGVSSVPLFGLSTIHLDKSKEFIQSNDLITSLSDRNSSMSFFDHSQKLEDIGAKHGDVLNRNASFSFFENVGSPIQKEEEYDQDKNQEKSLGKTSPGFFESVDASSQDIKANIPENQDIVTDRDQSDTKKNDIETTDDIENTSELNICETCREVTHPEDKENDQDVTTQLIENITSPIQLSNPVEALLSGTGQQEPTNTEQVALDAGQFDEISHITEETIETINVQSATELLEDVDEIKSMNYGWANENALKEDYKFNVDPNPIGFYGSNSLFFDKVSTNADEIKHQENLLARQMSAPSAPPAEEEEEDDTKSDGGGTLDVHSIEQDANKDFPLFEEFVIEPEADDDDYKEKAESDLDSFTNRVEKFKNMDPIDVTEQQQSLFFEVPPQPISMVSYFDTGNYAVETHYRNTKTISIPPGFEEEFKRRLALAKQKEEKIRNEMKTVPETSTQTRTTSVATYSAARMAPKCTTAQAIGFNVEANIANLVDELSEQEFPTDSSSILVRSIENIVDDPNEKLPELSTASIAEPDGQQDPLEIPSFKAEEKLESNLVFETVPSTKLFDIEKSLLPDTPVAFSSFPAENKESIQAEQTTVSTSKPTKLESKLPDPINFFTDTTPENPPETFNRLASYFSSPPKTEHAKSFFELSQSQNHYRHASTNEKSKIIDLMNDLTSVQNITVTNDQTVRHINYFTVEYDTVLPDFNKGDAKKEKAETADDNDKIDLDSVVTNCRYCAKIFNTGFSSKVRTAMNDNSDTGSSTPTMEPHKEAGRGSVTVNFDGLTLHEEPNEGIAGMNENRSATEYTPVKHHWFYRVDVEDKSIWRGFSVVDSRALETSYLSPDLTDQTVVATDGGRYDVNVMGRLRIPVYWSDKPTNVRRCSWFYKGTTDARYVPYTEPVAEKLEEEYRHGMTTGEWHRRLVIPNGEVVVMHGPSVMVHFLHSDAFSTPPQSSSRPRVVRRGHDESEIEDTEPSSIDHLLLLCHGVGSACDMRFRSVEEVVEDFRATSLQLIQSHYRNSYDQGIVSRVEVLPISWHATLHSGETGVDRRLSQITLDSIPRLRSFTNDTVLDVLFYTSPVFCQTIMDTVCTELNRIYQLFVQRNPSFKGGVSLGGHSLGSVILYDLLCHQADVATDDTKPLADKHFVKGSAGTGQPCVRYPSLAFAPDAMYALGSPIAIFECIRGVESLGASFSLPTCKNFFNIFHPYDPIAYRIEPLIDPRLRDLKPFLIPHHKGRKRMHLELKDTMARVGADLKQKLLESLKSTWNKWKAQPPPDGQLEKVVEEEMEKENLCDDSNEDMVRESELSTPDVLGSLNDGRRVDYVLQEAPLEMINEYLFAMSSHVGYWESEDTMLLMLREIYSALGVQPDSTVPQQNMTVQRTKTSRQDDAIVLNASEFPSTSHGPK